MLGCQSGPPCARVSGKDQSAYILRSFPEKTQTFACRIHASAPRKIEQTMLLPVRIPKPVRRHIRDLLVDIRRVPDRDAPVVGPVRVTGRRSDFQIRFYDDRFWWPLFSNGRPLTSDRYAEDARLAQGAWAAMMHTHPAWIRQFDGTYGQKLQPNAARSAYRRMLADEVASQTLFCDRTVFVAAGYPAYFIYCGPPDGASLRAEIGPAHHPFGDGIHSYLPGPSPAARREAARNARLVRPAQIDDAIARLRDEGFMVEYRSRLLAYRGTLEGPAPAILWTDAILREAASRTGRAADRLSRGIWSEDLSVLPIPPDTVPPGWGLRAIERLISVYGPHLTARWNLDPEALQRACDALRPLMLTPDDEVALLKTIG